jgi:hypothetical protein
VFLLPLDAFLLALDASLLPLDVFLFPLDTFPRQPAASPCDLEEASRDL